MQDIYKNNIQIIEKRWPEIYQRLNAIEKHPNTSIVNDGPEETLLVNGIHLTSSYDQKKEAALLADLIPQSSDTAWVYGLAKGRVCQALMKRINISAINLVILSLPLLRACLELVDYKDVLSDSRVTLCLAEKMTSLQMPMTLVPSCLRLADEAAVRISDMLLAELNTPYINQRYQSNTYFLQQIKDNEERVKVDHNVSELFNSMKGQVFHITAAGPSLSEHYSALMKRADGSQIIAVDASLRALSSHNVQADYVVSVDGVRKTILSYLDLNLSPYKSVPLIYLPVVHKDVLEKWPGPRYTAYSSSQMFSELRDRLPKGELYVSGSVIHPAVDLAVKMGAKEIRLYGADFSYPGGNSHVAEVGHVREIDVASCQRQLANGYGEKVYTDNNLCGYLRDLESYISLHPEVNFINMSRSGACIHGAQHMDNE